MVVCEICERGWELEADKFEKSIKEDGAKSPIPFMHRYGLLVLIGFIVLCWIFSAIGKHWFIMCISGLVWFYLK